MITLIDSSPNKNASHYDIKNWGINHYLHDYRLLWLINKINISLKNIVHIVSMIIKNTLISTIR